MGAGALLVPVLVRRQVWDTCCLGFISPRLGVAASLGIVAGLGSFAPFARTALLSVISRPYRILVMSLIVSACQRHSSSSVNSVTITNMYLWRHGNISCCLLK
jgi:hypothetical protein